MRGLESSALGRSSLPSKIDHQRLIVALSLVIAFSSASFVVLVRRTSAQPLLGWTPPSQPGFPLRLSGARIEYSSPVVADLDLDGKDEIIMGGLDGGLYAVKSNGTLMWENQTSLPIQSSPAVGDIDADGWPEVVVGVSGDNCDEQGEGGVYAFSHDGTLLWKFVSGDYCEYGNGWPDGVRSSVALGDVDQNDGGKLEIVFGSWDLRVHMLDERGIEEPGWPIVVWDTVWSSPALADINEDSYLEIIIGYDTSPPVLPSGGRLTVYDRFGNELSGFPRQVDETIWSSPAVGDLDGNGHLEIVVGTGFYWEQMGYHTTHAIYAWDRFGNPLPGWPVYTGGSGFSSPALADLDDDGDLEIVIGCNDGKVYAWHHTGVPDNGWPVRPYGGGHLAPPFVRSSPGVADYDGDGDLEILITAQWEIIIFERDGTQVTDGSEKGDPSKPTFNANSYLIASPAIGDIDDDGTLEVIIGGTHYADPSHGYLYVWRVGPSAGAELPWPMFHQNAQHTGLYPSPPTLSVDKESLLFLHEEGGSTSPSYYTITIRNRGLGSINWTATASQPEVVSVTPSSGTATASSPSQIIVTVDASGYSAGTYDLGSITIDGGSETENSPAVIQPVTLYVGEVERVFLPLVTKGY